MQPSNANPFGTVPIGTGPAGSTQIGAAGPHNVTWSDDEGPNIGESIKRVARSKTRLFILIGFLLTAASLWQMTGYSLYMGSGPILFAGFAQGFGLGCTFVPLNLLALSGLQ